MRFSALLLIAALLLKSVAGFAMAGCHADHQPTEPVAAWLLDSSDSTATVPTFLDESPANPLPNKAKVCSLCASCCVTTTPPLDQAGNHLPPFPELIQSPDFVDLSVCLTRATQPPRQA